MEWNYLLSCHHKHPCQRRGWSDWSNWSTKILNVDIQGIQTRTRTCTNPVPANGGAYCSGSNIETQSYANPACPIPTPTVTLTADNSNISYNGSTSTFVGHLKMQPLVLQVVVLMDGREIKVCLVVFTLDTYKIILLII